MNEGSHPLTGFDFAGSLSGARGAVHGIFAQRCPSCSTSTIAGLFDRVEDLFLGRFPGYHGCDTAYHDLAHTCRVTVCTAQMLDGHIRSGAPPVLEPRDFEMAVAAALLHDSGYFREIGDAVGTGAKYTCVHVDRSVDFVGRFLPALGMTGDEIRIIQQAIRCTGLDVDMSTIRFRDPRERYLGCAVGTGDMLSQMAAPDYPTRLRDLHVEFVEARAHEVGDAPNPVYDSARDLMRGAREFYDRHVTGLLDRDWDGVYRDLNHHFGDGTNPYLQAIAFNLDEIDRILRRGAA